MSVFSQRLIGLRKAAALSQREVARRVGLSPQAISNLELGNNPPAWETAQLLARLFGVSLDVFADPAVTLPKVQRRQAGRPRKEPPPVDPPPARPKGRGRR